MMRRQTQVNRVLTKYHEFLTRYPSFRVLAKAPVAEVIKVWYPLGYNFRPRRLHTIAHQVITDFAGVLPDSLEELMKLLGIGRYTAGAILNFAFHVDAPILDTNVRRVLQRVFGVPGDPFRVPAKHWLWQLATEVIPRSKGYLFNQALMDFGAMVCTARSPRCDTCIYMGECHWYAQQTAFESRT